MLNFNDHNNTSVGASCTGPTVSVVVGRRSVESVPMSRPLSSSFSYLLKFNVDSIASC